MSSFREEEANLATGDRIIDMGGLDPDCEEDGGEGKNLVIVALDPGTTTGWSALKVPVADLSRLGVARTLARCRWRHGQILRSGEGLAERGPMGLSVSDSRHVSMIEDQIETLYYDFVYTPDEEGEAEGWEADKFVLVIEHFKLRMMSMDDNLLAPVRVEDRLLDRLWTRDSATPVFFQSPSDAMTTVTDNRLKSWCMYDAHSGPHARDADRHAILFLRRFANSREIRSRLGFA